MIGIMRCAPLQAYGILARTESYSLMVNSSLQFPESPNTADTRGQQRRHMLRTKDYSRTTL